MIVDKAKIEEWTLLLKRGDYQEIEKVSGMPRQQVSRAVRTGKMAQKTFLVLQDYFSGKKEMIKKEQEKQPV